MYNEIKVVAIDVDGTLTDGIYQISDTGTVTKSFCTKDFYGIEELMRNGISVIILTQSHDEVILKQIDRICGHSDFWRDCYSMGTLSVSMAVDNKKEEVLNIMCDAAHIDSWWDNIAYMGDAENDMECIRLAGFSGCPTDAIPQVRDIAMYPSDYFGGRGAVHDFCMYIIAQREKETEDENT